MHKKVLALSIASLVLPWGLAAADTLEDAQRLMRDARPDQAYELLAPALGRHAGDAAYLYATAVAALDSGNAEAALPLFEQTLKLNPEHGGALIDLGRARLRLGNPEGARSAFEAARKLNPPAALVKVIEQLLAAATEQERVLAPQFHAYGEAGLGHDDNLNSATTQSQVPIPLFGNALMTLNSANVGTASDYTSLAAGAEVVKPLDQHRALYGTASLAARNYANHSDFDSLLPEIRGGLILTEGRHFFRAGLSASQYYLGGSRNRDVFGINGDWYYVLTPDDRIGLFTQYSDYRFRDSLANEDFQQSVLGASWSHKFAAATELSAAFYAAAESAPRRTDGDKDVLAARVSLSHQYSPGVSVFAGAGYQSGEYHRSNILFLTTRRDEQYDVSIGATYRLDKDWSARGQWTYIDNQSNIGLNKYNRSDISFVIRRDF